MSSGDTTAMCARAACLRRARTLADRLECGAARERWRRSRAAWGALLALCAGCSSESPGSAQVAGSPAPVMSAAESGTPGAVSAAEPSAAVSGSAGAGASGSGKLSFAADVYERVIRARCGQCHSDAPSFGGLAMFPGAMTAYSNLVGVPAGSEAGYQCRNSGLARVEPGAPERSLLYLKLTAPPCGSKMPPAAFGQVTSEQVELVRQWIAEGAAP